MSRDQLTNLEGQLMWTRDKRRRRRIFELLEVEYKKIMNTHEYKRHEIREYVY